MEKKSVLWPWWAVVYLLLAALDIAAEVGDIRPLYLAVKPLLMTTLMAAWLSLSDGEDREGIKKISIISLLFCLLGDFYLMADRDQLFIYGLGAFLVAHLFYIRIFWKVKKWRGKDWGWLLAASLHGAVIFPLLLPEAGDLYYPILAYGVVIGLMLTGALVVGMAGELPTQPRYLVLAGALFFVLSDSLIGINRFHTPLAYHRLWILSTYFLGQLLIHDGLMALAKLERD